MNKVRTVIFDMDGTMLDTEKIYYKANQETADRLGLDYSFETYAQFIGAGDKEHFEGMRQLYPENDVLEQFFAESVEELEYQLLNGPVDKKAGLVELLDYLQTQDIPAIVASSTRRKLVEHLLDRLELRDHFVDVVGGDEVANAKPDPAIFEKAFIKTKLDHKDEALILEDSKNGVRAAYNADVPVILIPDMVEADAEMEEKTADILPDLHQVTTYIQNKNK